MDKLEALQKANPQIAIYSVNDPAFKPYGRVVQMDTKAFCQAAEAAVTLPEEGSKYLASVPELEAVESTMKILENEVYGELPIQIGY